MSYPINYPTPQGANIQIFNGSGSTLSTNISTRTWVKPQGASFVWFTLIGPGGDGGQADVSVGGGGGSGAVTNFMCPAFLIPDDLQVLVGRANVGPTSIIYQQKNGTGYELLRANNASSGSDGSGGVGASAMSPNAFTAMGFLQSTAGQDGTTGVISASATTFLSGGPGDSGNTTANYGYSVLTSNKPGFFQMQPIIVGVSNSGSVSVAAARSAIGCGGSGNTATIAASLGGDGMVVIITW